MRVHSECRRPRLPPRYDGAGICSCFPPVSENVLAVRCDARAGCAMGAMRCTRWVCNGCDAMHALGVQWVLHAALTNCYPHVFGPVEMAGVRPATGRGLAEAER